MRVIAKRADGYHDLETVFYPVNITDVLEIVRSTTGITSVTSTGLSLPGAPEDNLCYKAWALLRERTSALPEVSMHLHKVIPTGAGLGGGSADAAFALKLLNEQFQLGFNVEELMGFALQLGSDCPYFLANKLTLATGRGEKLTPLSRSLSGLYLVIINPGIHISTATAFGSIQPSRPSSSLADIIGLPIEHWKGQLLNDFEEPMKILYPEIADILAMLYAHGARYAAMSGTGSTVFGLFDREPALPGLPAHYFYRSVLCEQ